MDPRTSEFVGIIAGPTASGKSTLAVEVALRHNLAIISADSMQVYRGMEIGTGAIPPEEQRGVPHYLLGIADPREEFHAARFVDEARAAAAREWKQHGRRSLVVGGTGMWIQALREGLFEGPGRDEALRVELREVLEREGAEALHERLRQVDPAMAEQLSPRDHVRVLRAIEVFEISGRTLTSWQEEDRARREALTNLLPLYVINLPREQLRRRIDERVDEMLAAGWLEEAERLWELDLPNHAPARKALGYRQLFRVIKGEINDQEARQLIKTETKKFAKRQLTWFRGQREAQFDTTPTVERCEAALSL